MRSHVNSAVGGLSDFVLTFLLKSRLVTRARGRTGLPSAKVTATCSWVWPLPLLWGLSWLFEASVGAYPPEGGCALKHLISSGC